MPIPSVSERIHVRNTSKDQALVSQLVALMQSPLALEQENVAQYYSLLNRINYLLLFGETGVQKFVQENLPFATIQDELAIIAPGSQGRLEAALSDSGFNSCLELIVLLNFEQLAQLAEIMNILQSVSCAGALQLKNNMFEVVTLNTNFIVSADEGNVRHSWPDRVVDSQLVFGAQCIHHIAMNQVNKEWQTMKKVRDAVQDYLRQFIRTTTTGTTSIHHVITQQFNPEKGVVYFDESKNIFGLKLGPIRALQVFLTKYQLSRNQSVPIGLSTVNKLQHLFSDVEDVALAYQQALYLYHWQQYQSKIGKQTQVQLGQRYLGKILDPMLEFVKRPMRDTK